MSQEPGNSAPAKRSTATEEKLSNRAKRKIEQERDKQRRLIFTIVGGVLAIAVAGLIIWAITRKPEVPPLTIAAPIEAEIPTDGMTMGNPDAKVTLVEWGDYSCPGCGNFSREVQGDLVEMFVKPGLVRFEYRPFPLDIHGNEAVLAARAATCAADQGNFWQYHESLFLNQRGNGSFTEPALEELASQTGLDVPAFRSCLKDPATADRVSASVQAGKDASVDSTPSFFVNGTKVSWQGWDTLQQDLEKALK